MCVQLGPRGDGSKLASNFVGGLDWDAGCGDDRQDTSGIFFSGQSDQGDLPRAADFAQGSAEGHPDGATEFRYERSRQPMPRLGPWRERLEASLEANAQKPPRDRLTLVRIFEDMQGLGFDGSYAAVRRYAVSWREKHSSATSTAYIPLTFAPGEAYQFDLHGALPVKSFCCSRVRFCRTPVSRGMSGFDCSGRCMRVRMSPIAVGGKSGERETGVKDAQHRRSRHARSACP